MQSYTKEQKKKKPPNEAVFLDNSDEIIFYSYFFVFRIQMFPGQAFWTLSHLFFAQFRGSDGIVKTSHNLRLQHSDGL